MDAEMRVQITYDPDADAMYVRLREPTSSGTTEVDENGTIMDLDERGQPLGYEFLSVRSSGIRPGALPPAIRTAVREFLSSGALDSAKFVERFVDADEGGFG